MKTICISILILFNLDLFSQQKPSTINLIDGEIKKGHLFELLEDTIALTLAPSKVAYIAATDILDLRIQTKKDNSGTGALIGGLIGVLPGIIILTRDRSDDGLVSIITYPAEVDIGFGVTIVGGIVGGILGYQIGKGNSITIPINASPDLYKRQKEKIKQLGF